MAANESPAGARRRLRLAMRQMRDRSGLTQLQVAKALDWSISKVNRFENGDVTLSVTDLHALLNLYGVDDEGKRSAHIEIARVARSRGWWHEARFREHVTPAMLRLAQFESQATAIRAYYPTLVDGLFQTPEYAHAVMTYGRDEISDATMSARADARTRWQADVLGRTDGPELGFLLDESVLYRAIGGLRVLVDQLGHLLDLMRRPFTTVRVLSMTDGALLALVGGFRVLDLENEPNAILYREFFMTDVISESEELIAEFRSRFDRGWAVALDESASRRLIEAKKADLLSSLDRMGEH